MATKNSDRILNLVYGKKAKEYSFNGSIEDEARMWNRYMKAVDSGKDQVAANVIRTLEENNWHSLNKAMMDAGDKPSNERESYFDVAEKVYDRDDDDRAELERLKKNPPKDRAPQQKRENANNVQKEDTRRDARIRRVGTNTSYKLKSGNTTILQARHSAMGKANVGG